MRVRMVGRALAVLLFAFGLWATPASAGPRGRVYVRVAPPPPVVEVRRLAPAPRYVWIGGHQRWTGRRYAWSPGYWSAPPRARAAWVPARWVRDRRGWYFVGGRWRY